MKDKARGKLEEIKGKLTADRREEATGKVRQAAGEAKRIGQDVRDQQNRPADDPDRS